MRFNIKGVPFLFRGAKDVSDCITAEEVIKKAGLNWTVEKCPLVARMPLPVEGLPHLSDDSFIRGADIYRDAPNAFATYRTDLNLPLGIVKGRYEEVQNIEAFQFFNDAIGKDKAIWQTAGSFGNGERIFVSAKLPYDIHVNDDDIDNYLVFTTSHDGSSGVKILFTPIRVVCQNTLNAAIKNTKNYVSFKHTSSVHSNISMAGEILGISKQIASTIQEQFKEMGKIRLTDQQAQQYFCDIILTKEEQQRVKDTGHTMGEIVMKHWNAIQDCDISMKKINVLSAINEYYYLGPGQDKQLGTGWGAYNAITGYYSNIDNTEGAKRMDSILYGSKASKIEDAGNIIFNYANPYSPSTANFKTV